MSSKKFEIFRVGSDGEVHRHLICLGGRVSVFRANRESLLEEFRVALQGRFPVQQFRIVLDGKKFQADQHILIGFGEKFDLESEGTVRTFLESSGIGDVNIDYCLKSYGLQGLETTDLKSLGENQQRLLRLLSATAKASDRVIILNDPFEGFPDELREDLANRVADFSYRTSAIVIITRLSERPECWIDNPIISRVQLERPRRETIGAGGHIDPEIQQLRQQLSSQPVRELTTPLSKPNLLQTPKPVSDSSAVLKAVKEAMSPQSETKYFSMCLAAGYLVVFTAIVWMFGFGKDSKPVAPPKVVIVKSATPIPTPETVHQVGFRGLPKNIQEQVMLAFRDPDSLLRSIPVKLDRRTPVTTEPPQTAHESTPESDRSSQRVLSEPAYDPSSALAGQAAPPNTEELERRREEIRQRLLSAIMARRQQLLEQQGQLQQ